MWVSQFNMGTTECVSPDLVFLDLVPSFGGKHHYIKNEPGCAGNA